MDTKETKGTKDGGQEPLTGDFRRELENGFLERFEAFKKQFMRYISEMAEAYENRGREEKANLTQEMKRLEDENKQAHRKLEEEKNQVLERERELERGIEEIKILKSLLAKKDEEVEQATKAKEEDKKSWEVTERRLRVEIRKLTTKKDEELQKVRGDEEQGEKEEEGEGIEMKEEGEKSEPKELEKGEREEEEEKKEGEKEREKNEEIEKVEKESEKKEKVETEEKENEKRMEKEGKEVQDETKESERREDMQRKKLPGAENKRKGQQKKEKSVDDRSKPKSGRNKGRQGQDKRKKFGSGGKNKWGKKKKKKKNYKKKSKSKSKRMSALEVKAEEDKVLEKMRVATERKLAKMKEKTEKKKQKETNDVSVGDVSREMNEEMKNDVDEFLRDLSNEVLEMYKETGTEISELKETLIKSRGVGELRNLAFDSAWGIDKEINRILAFTIYEFLHYIDELDAVACFSHGLLLIGGRSRSPGYCVVKENQVKGRKFLDQVLKLIGDKIEKRGKDELEQLERVVFWKTLIVHAYAERNVIDTLSDNDLKELIDLEAPKQHSAFEQYIIGSTYMEMLQNLDGEKLANVMTRLVVEGESHVAEELEETVKSIRRRAMKSLHSATEFDMAGAAIAIADVYFSHPLLFELSAEIVEKEKGDYFETLLKEAASQCEPYACFKLAGFYENGLQGVGDDGVLIEPDFGKAREYYEKARRLGFVHAKKCLLRMQILKMK